MMNQVDIEIESVINDLYANNGRKLHQICDKQIIKFGGVSQQDYDDFYSRVGYEIAKAKNTYDPSKGKTFMEYIGKVIKYAVYKEKTDKNRGKRQNFIEYEEKDENGNIVKRKEYISNMSIDTPIGDEDGITIADTLQSDFNMDNIFDFDVKECSENVKEYLNSLSDMPRKVAELIMMDYVKEDIVNILKITEKQFKICMDAIKSYDKKRILYEEGNKDAEVRVMDIMTMEQSTVERYKNTSYSIESISKQLKKKKIRDDHILQRHSGQWKTSAKSELIADILRGKSLTQIIICEEFKDSLRMQWLIDGKQRCTTLDSYLHDEFAISKNVKNSNIKYQTTKVDENGNEILNEDGFSCMEWKVFDIRGKKFSQLPEDLQDIFKDRQIPVLYEMNCTKKDIAEDIARFNRSRPMNKAQNGWLELEEDFAELVENIAKMTFFQPEFEGSSYTKTTTTSGTIRRIIVESIMVSDFIDDFGDFNQMCNFLSEEASDSNFVEFYSLVERLTEICKGGKNSKLFNTKDSFLWFGLFSKFSDLCLDDKNFADFMDKFDSLQKIEIDGKSFEDILNGSKSTKERSIVKKKMEHLEALMKKYFAEQNKRNNNIINIKSRDEDFYTDEEIFISEILHIDLEELHKDIEFYNDTLINLTSNTIKDGSKLLDNQNKLSLLTMVAYSYKQDVDLENWLTEYAKNNNTYILDQKNNFLHMKEDFEKFNNYGNKKSA